MNNAIEYLDWDSTFFGYKVAQIIPERLLSTNDLENALKFAVNENFKLLYYKVKKEGSFLNELKDNYNIILADKKATFKQELTDTEEQPIDPQFSLYSKTVIEEKLLNITLQSGVFSRFATDPNFKNEEFKKLYTEWIKKSVSGELAKEVWVSTDNDKQINGLITLGMKNNVADIGLLAVDKEARGLNIGSKLIKLAKLRAARWGEKELQVVTQLENVPACRFYEKQGFRLTDIEYIYHIWI